MGQPGYGGALDTPRTNLGDATYLSRAPDFADISQEASFVSPTKEDGNLLQQLRNGRSNGISLRTPRRRGALADRQNLPPSVGGAEFTPLLKSATRNSVRKRGKENDTMILNTPGLNRIDENDVTPLPRMDMSVYSTSRNQSYLDNTLPQVESSSAASTPLALPPRRGGDKGPLNDGNQLSLREQENVIDRIEKENFGLKLKIHFLEEALRRAGPGFSEAALKENTELKVDKVTMQRELHKYKKHLTSAERDLESYRQQMVELQEKARRKYADESQRAEMEKLRQAVEEREADIEQLQRQIDQEEKDQDRVEKLRDDIGDLEADLREKDRQLTERDDELEELKEKLEEAEENAKDSERRVLEVEQNGQSNEELDTAKDTIQDLEHDIRRLEDQLDDAKEKMDEAVAEKQRAERDLEELQEEMADKSVVTKGLSRQIDERVVRLQEELDRSGQEYAALEKDLAAANQKNENLEAEVAELRREKENFDHDRQETATQIQELETELLAKADEKDLIQSRHDALTAESAGLQEDIAKLEKEVKDLEADLQEERDHELDIEKDLRNQYQSEIERLNDQVSDLQAEIREKDNLYDNDSEKWETEKHNMESERDRAIEKAAGLQRTIDRLQAAEGTLSDKESKVKEALESETERHKSEEGVLTRQIEDLQAALDTRQTLLTTLRNELSTVRDELRQTQINYQNQINKVVSLEDELEVLQNKTSGSSFANDKDLAAARRESDDLREQLRQARQTSGSIGTPSRLKWQLSDAETQLDQSSKEKQSLQDQIASINLELHSVKSSLAEVTAERDELDEQLRQTKTHGNDDVGLDQERLTLRTAKMKLDNEVRRLKDENRSLTDQREAIEKTLEEEIEKAAEEEERLGQEILQLQAKCRQSASSETQELAAARRNIRELERRVEDYQNQLLSADNHGSPVKSNGDMSVVRRDLTSARQKELEFLQREAAHRDVVKGLQRQINDLERELHNHEMSRLIESPKSSNSDLGKVYDGSDLRQQLRTARQSINDLKIKHRDAERKASQTTEELQRQLNELEDQKIVLEEVLDEARQQAEENAAENDRILRRMKHKLDKAERERNAIVNSHTNNDKHGRHLRKSQAEIENLEHDIRQQQELVDALVASEGSLRRKLERARSERAMYRMSAEKLQRDMSQLRNSASPRGSLNLKSYNHNYNSAYNNNNAADEAIGTVVRAAESADERHKKELKGMVMQMEWMQKRWEREASLRADAAYAKKFTQLQLDIANACNKAQLRELEHIRTNLLGSRKPLILPSTGMAASSSSLSSTTRTASGKPSLKTLLLASRFIARMRISARAWAEQEVVRRKLVVANEEQKKTRKSRKLKVVRMDEVV